MDKGKSYEISRHQVMEAFKMVKVNKGAAGVDGITIEVFEADLKKQSVQAMEQDVIRQLFSYACQRRGNT